MLYEVYLLLIHNTKLP